MTQPKDEEIKESEVTSTVSIKTPEENIIASTNPSVWNGDIDMPDVARFSVTAHQVSGTSDYLGMVTNKMPATTIFAHKQKFNNKIWHFSLKIFN